MPPRTSRQLYHRPTLDSAAPIVVAHTRVICRSGLRACPLSVSLITRRISRPRRSSARSTRRTESTRHRGPPVPAVSQSPMSPNPTSPSEPPCSFPEGREDGQQSRRQQRTQRDDARPTRHYKIGTICVHVGINPHTFHCTCIFRIFFRYSRMIFFFLTSINILFSAWAVNFI